MNQFHFLRPEWFFALIPLALVVYALTKMKLAQSGWQHFIPNHLAALLMDTQSTKRHMPIWLVSLVWLITVLALAGPTYQKIPQPVYQINAGKVVLLDMSLSMRATDIKPNRLTKMRFKAIDLVNNLDQGDVGLIAYAGDAFVISPLTADGKNLTTLIPSLTPEIMPAQGSDPLLALEKAHELLMNAGYTEGDIYWVTDGIDYEDIEGLQSFVKRTSHRINILGVGTEDGAPIKQVNGELLKDFSGSIIIPKLNASPLNSLARSTSGYYADMTQSDRDVQYLSSIPTFEEVAKQKQEQAGDSLDDKFGDQWQEVGPFLVLLILPFAAYAFRKGVLSIAIISLMFGSMLPKPAYANWWDDMWKTRNQQGQDAFQAEKYDEAASLFENQNWKSTAQFSNKDYEGAANGFKNDKSSNGWYNQGNALAHQQKFEEAIAAYDEALKLQPDFSEAKDNQELIKQLLEAMKQNQENGDNQQNQDQNQDGQEQQDSDQQQGGQNSQQSDGDSENSESSDNSQSPQQDSEEQSPQGQDNQPRDEQSNDSEQSGAQNEQNSDAQKKQDDEAKSEQADEDSENQAEQGSKEEAGQPSEKEGQKEASQMQQVDPSQLTDEQKEQKQLMKQLMRKVHDDPSMLLRNKMILESRKRKREGYVIPGESKKW